MVAKATQRLSRLLTKGLPARRHNKEAVATFSQGDTEVSHGTMEVRDTGVIPVTMETRGRQTALWRDIEIVTTSMVTVVHTRL